eukprot:1158858-Pelagomonas_calceolata.AAC.11
MLCVYTPAFTCWQICTLAHRASGGLTYTCMRARTCHSGTGCAQGQSGCSQWGRCTSEATP